MGYTSFNLSAVSFMRPDYVPVDASQAEYDKKVIQPGLVDHEAFEVTEQPVTTRVQESQLATVKKTKTGKITIFDQETLDRLRAWEKESIPIHVYGAGNQCLLWEKPSQFNITRSLKTREGLQGFDVELTTTDSLQNPLIKWASNILYAKFGPWADLNNDGYADNWNFNGMNQNSFANGIQTVENTDDTSASISNSIFFPVKGVDLLLSATYQKRSGGVNFLADVLDYDSNDLLSSVNANVNIGLNTHEFNTPERIYRILVRLVNKGSNFDFDVSYPTLSTFIKGKAEY